MTSGIEHDREQVVQTLCAHYAYDHLSTQELEQRFEHAERASTSAELRALVVGLPELPTGALPPPPFALAAQTDAVTEERRHVVVMSSVRKKGGWTPAHRNLVRCVMGSAKFDLRDALIVHGETLFDLRVVMGEVELIIPPGLRVECDGFAFMGEFDDAHAEGTAPPDAPLIRIAGSVIMGAVRIKTRLPGESALAAWRRRLLNGAR